PSSRYRTPPTSRNTISRCSPTPGIVRENPERPIGECRAPRLPRADLSAAGQRAKGLEAVGVGERGAEPDGVVAGAVAIGPARPDQAEAIRDARVLFPLFGGVVGVIDLEARHPRLGH